MKIRSYIEGRGRPVKYLVSGGLAFATEYLSFVLMISMSIGTIFSNSISFTAGLVVSFTLNRLWVFQVRNEKYTKQFVRYAMLAVVNLIVSNLIIVSLISFGLFSLVAKILTMGAIAVWNYYIFSKLIFKKID